METCSSIHTQHTLSSNKKYWLREIYYTYNKIGVFLSNINESFHATSNLFYLGIVCREEIGCSDIVLCLGCVYFVPSCFICSYCCDYTTVIVWSAVFFYPRINRPKMMQQCLWVFSVAGQWLLLWVLDLKIYSLQFTDEIKIG